MKFEMNCWTVDLIAKEGLIVTKGLVERQMTLFDYRVVINTNKPNGIVQLGRDSVDLTHTDKSGIRASLESLVHVEKRRKGGLINFGPGGSYSIPVTKEQEKFGFFAKGSAGDLEAMSLHHGNVFSSCDPHRASGRTFRALLDVMKTASESPEGSLTLFVVLNDIEVYSSYNQLTHVMGRMLGGVLNDNNAKTLTFENQTIQVVSKNSMNFTNHSFGKGKRINVVYDHTVQGN